MNFDLTEEQSAFARSARAFARAEFAPHAARWDAEAIFPREAIAQAGKLGFCGLYAPEAAGGLALPRLDATLVFEELAAVDPSTSAFISIHNMATWMLGTWATPAVREHWGPLLSAGEKLASYCLTEPGAGSDAAALKTRAERVRDEYHIDGSKAFISGAGSTDVLLLMARTGGADSGAGGISAFVVPADAAGISYGKKEHKMGWNSQPTRSIRFDGVRIPADHLLGRVGEGFKIAMQGLDGGRINIAACSVGAAQGALEAARQHMHERCQFGQPIAHFQALQFRLADMATELVAARQMVRLAASKLDAGARDASTYCAMAKRFATDAGFAVCNEALQLHGGYGYIREYPLERLLRDVRVHQILEGSNEIMRVIIARRMLDGDAPDTIR
ncbi:acyl-CoA dehydrogenase family protein [Verminephrobacter aporrectodeae]|uniref:Acyl-CoA dehydrogenase n=1 Tax=Verminephrobacter aporrectodeae subsp. tuberculatae TaxID=1110392 RepID=A0ABT3KPK0_9BURK|nr:acyl-CoA dehydrogenase family protein [Verminephrobacter aporrectodeae]MCW5220817.1 acyl-CoA dehydrogenase [Verminephrobacter aporrectodeae subsp. tuberculatae]MCW5255222.1 acyl-CoA dehydrogenase [Verminephrobacter aporrectodeae subsp. tuberculatae]MCW5290112.1 acyl-CoA dehydrogenase [Verminephrobacter aporrectodeae subsp. tuberculatae]MCW5320238.1 acyl-CoA dehydrogenase [Verminephrobacter aporrectodeae subsp. tuberculatae]MCW8164079.1 acyl-CoA dehydrogenase [Verminephrobacter aporrectodeae